MRKVAWEMASAVARLDLLAYNGSAEIKGELERIESANLHRKVVRLGLVRRGES